MTGNDEKPREEDDARWITMEMLSEITVKNRFPMKKVCTPHAEILSLKRFGALSKQVGDSVRDLCSRYYSDRFPEGRYMRPKLPGNRRGEGELNGCR
jgi:hypothetical protein